MPLLTPGANRFKPVALYKEGKFNVVSLVLELADQKERVARLLTLPPGASEAELLEGLHREAQMLKALSHPNLPRFDKVVEGSGGTWLLFHPFTGTPLAHYQNSQTNVSQTWIMWWLAELLKALQALHESTPPMIVGYLDPSDVLIQDDRLVIADLGIFEDVFPEVAARHLSRHPHVDFIAPERRMAAQTLVSSDLYSAAAIAYWLCTGHAPVIAGPHAEEQVLAALRDYRPQLPEEVAHLLSEGLAFYPSHRPASAQAMLERLSPYVGRMAGKKAPSFSVAGDSSLKAADSTRSMKAIREGLDDNVKTLEKPRPAPVEEAPRPPVSARREFLEDLLWQVRRHPVAVGVLAVGVALGAAAGLSRILRPDLPASPPLMTVTRGSVLMRSPHPTPGQPDWVPIRDVPAGAVLTVEPGTGSLTFDHGSTLVMGADPEIQCLGREHDGLGLQASHGVLDFQTAALDTVYLHLPGDALVTMPPGAAVEVDLSQGLTATLKQGSASVTRQGQTSPLLVGQATVLVKKTTPLTSRQK
ncbi:MAG TPA: protein kinase [Candidatus Xenobia bacterium]|jgi:hypothetical protein